MGHSESGNGDNYPETALLPDDGDDIEAGSVNVPFEALLDRTEWLREEFLARSFASTTFSTAGITEWTAPERVTCIILEGCGGGGGGGGGANGSTTANAYATGGGGGGGAQRQVVVVLVTPGTVYEIVVGAGGQGGPAAVSNNPGSDGGDGGDTIFREKASGTVLARFKGATGGRGGFLFVSPTRRGVVPGGAPFSAYRPVQLLWETGNETYGLLPVLSGPGAGGEGISSNLAGLPFVQPRNGSGSLEGRLGGPAGTAGTGPGASAPAGGPGGGGGASAYGSGYPGGDGGNGNGAGAGGNAPAFGAGGSAPGVGGGGGGGGGTGTSGSGGAGTPGLSGSSGVLILRPAA